MNLYHIAIHPDSPRIVNAVIEIPKDTNVKYEYDAELGVFKYDRSLLSAMVYPANYGFIPNTIADDGDPLDIVIYNSMPIQSGTVVEARPIGILKMIDGGQCDHKILAVPTSHVKQHKDIGDIDPQFLKISSNFFAHYKDLNGSLVEVFEWESIDESHRIINESVKS